MELTQWLRAQLDEDERIAQAAMWCEDAAVWRAASSEYGTPTRPGGPRWYIEDSMEDGVITTVDPQASADEGVARHIAEWDPARVLREINAKRRALDHYLAVRQHAAQGAEPYTLAEGAVAKQIQIMATGYADRPGYREEWRP